MMQINISEIIDKIIEEYNNYMNEPKIRQRGKSNLFTYYEDLF